MPRIIAIALLALSAQTQAEPAPTFSLPTFSLQTTNKAEPISLSDYRGKVIYLDFWASWCAPCRISLPLLNELHNELGTEDFTVLAINIDEDITKAKRFLQRYPVDYPILLDTSASVAEAYELPAMPTSFIIDQNGNITYTHVGLKEKDIEEIRGHVVDLLNYKKNTSLPEPLPHS